MSADQDTTPMAEAAAPVAAPAVVAPVTGLTKLSARLPEIVKTAAHSEMWGVELGDADQHVPTKVVLQKFLRANNDDDVAAEKQLTAALEWRKKMEPTTLVNKVFDEKKFGGLGYVTVHKDKAGKETVITWNVYGVVKSFKVTFGDIEEFLEWRTALMELGVQKLNLSAVTEPILDGAEDPYQMIQVHDYLSVSFLRMDPHVKAASSETIKVFSTAYPELLAHKYFVNVPTIMGWMYAAMKLFLAPATLKKFHPMRSGTSLVAEVPRIDDSLPKEYGGRGASIQEQGLTIKLEAKKEEIPAESGDAPVAAITEPVEEPKSEDKHLESKLDDLKLEEPNAATNEAKTDISTAPLPLTEEKPATAEKKEAL